MSGPKPDTNAKTLQASSAASSSAMTYVRVALASQGTQRAGLVAFPAGKRGQGKVCQRKMQDQVG